MAAGLLLVAGIANLVAVVDEDGADDRGRVRSPGGRRRGSCRSVVFRALPTTAIKTVVVVWQIITQV